VNRDSYAAMLDGVRAFHDKHRLRENGGEELLYRIALMTEELGEIAESVTKGKARSALTEELADLLILVMGTGIALDADLNQAFWDKLRKLETRTGRMIDGRVRVSEFRDPE
jgi:NTP pyrophosphatase (non-canonical NTP hydrolase)